MLIRPRRLRLNSQIRALTAETRLNPSMLVYPIFIREGKNIVEEISAMPGQFRYSPDEKLCYALEKVVNNKISSVLFFGIPDEDKKDEIASPAWDENGVVQQAIRLAKKNFPELNIIADVCMCEYTNHGHCGMVNEKSGVIENDVSLNILERIATSQVQAGADIVAPSAMLDGQVQAIRNALDNENFYDALIFSYAVKYASSFYGPFREAAGSAPSFGDRKSYQMNPRNVREAVKEALTDIDEGADMIILKPALSYLDVIKTVHEKILNPVAAYSVSGEYSMIKAAAQKGWLNETQIISEMAIATARAGADILITYYANELANLMNTGNL